MSTNVTPTQALLIFGLLALHGECAQAELMPAVTKADREALEKAGLIDVRKVGRAFVFTLSDTGWNWAGANLSAELPPAHGALQALLGRLGEHLAKENETLAGFIGAKPTEKVEHKRERSLPKAKAGRSTEQAKKPTSRATKKTTTKSKTTKETATPRAPSPATLRKRIETAYMSLTGGRKNESIKLARLRAALPDLDRTVVDAALGRILKGDKTASLMRHDDPNQLDSADHAAAFAPAGEPFHVIWIAS